MAPVRNAQAAACQPRGLLTPSAEDMAALLGNPLASTPLKVCSGGTTSRCAAANHWTWDLAPKLRQFSLNQQTQRVRFGSGWTMGALQNALADQGCMVSSGLSGLPGAGYVLTGGMGPLSRSLGLAIDHVQGLSGVWGNGRPFALQRDHQTGNADGAATEAWTALLGAAMFLGIVQGIDLQTVPLVPLKVVQGCVAPQRLAELITRAETFPRGLSLQWCWGDAIEVMLVARVDDLSALALVSTLTATVPFMHQRSTAADGLHQLPVFGALANPSSQETPRQPAVEPDVHHEVIGLLGASWGSTTPALITALAATMQQRPHPRCSLACQQLGGAVGDQPTAASAFRHRNAEWKPWITASWPAGDGHARQAALDWLETVWNELSTTCPGIHLAQLHDHLPWHGRELERAFGPWLPSLRQLKAQLDPQTLLPPL
ncbi:MAG: FAD-binding protein [Synechococcus sp.]